MSLKEQSTRVKTGYGEMLALTDRLLSTMSELSSLAKDKPEVVHY
jgi:hypothetical protein